MNAEEVYKMYLAMKLHFTTDQYDYFKYNGKVKFNRDTFNKRNDRFFFSKLGKRFDDHECMKFFLANFLKKQNAWVGDLSDESYNSWQKVIESLQYQFSNDVSEIRNYLDNNDLGVESLFNKKNNNIPVLITLLYQNKITKETFLIFDILFRMIDSFDNLLYDDYIWKERSSNLKKYKSFFIKLVFDHEDRDKYLRIIKEKLIS